MRRAAWTAVGREGMDSLAQLCQSRSSGPCLPNTGSESGNGTRGMVSSALACSPLLPRQRSYFPVLRIGADHHQIGTGPQALMAGAGRQHANVALAELDLLALVAAEADLGAAARDAHAFVDHRMVVHVGEDAVAPHVAPAVAAEHVLDHLFRIGRADQIDGAAIDHERQVRVVGHRAIVGEHEGLGLGWLGVGHRREPGSLDSTGTGRCGVVRRITPRAPCAAASARRSA